MIGETDPTVWAVLATAVVALAAQVGAWLVKRTKSPDAPTLEARLMDEWEAIAKEARNELGECRRERQRQDKVIAGQDRKINDLTDRLDRLEKLMSELNREVHQWRNGQRVPDGFVLQRAPLPPPPPGGSNS